MNVKNLTSRDHRFLQKMQDLHDPPASVRISGTLPDPTSINVAVVGSRKNSAYGREITEIICGQLVAKGIGVISGLAFGIDSIAHKATLASGGYTLAVLPGPLEHIYPRNHQNLAIDIINSGGAVLSEQVSPYSIQKHSFIQRNRLIAALSDAVVVIEAAERSGSLHTADFALQLTRPILAVPGDINRSGSAGTNNLIATGARPLLSTDDVLMNWGYPMSGQ